ncbi:hypothetical protein [Pontibacter sp. SGAir0037]|uniref:hypothetical protein n=1 Tax=Pontibacter sp. SGAir0037 TaxID=2571030 RepID=UPI0010CCF1B4|nr:hypothetical protein [Pontibacter sp. SGAir0037]QCR21204.1 hypothetical protein C1N53_01795 [Pontibacter sp. SGAir0037]
MTKIELTKANGDIFLVLEREENNQFICARWTGVQSLETVQKGGTAYLDMIRQQPCPKLLNSHRELIGPWDIANDWITSYWTPTAVSLGLQYMAQVLAPGVYGKMSFHQLHQRIDNFMEIKMFEEEEPAHQWLLTIK